MLKILIKSVLFASLSLFLLEGNAMPPPAAPATCQQPIDYSADEEPYGYYVCYQVMAIFQTSYSHFNKYDRFRYHNCRISYKPCYLDCKHNRTFGWFRTTYQAKNALYRCKENY